MAVGGAEFNDLNVESVPSCADDLRSMIDAYDRIYGDGREKRFSPASISKACGGGEHARENRALSFFD